MCVCCVYLLCVYINSNTFMCIYLGKICYAYILNVYACKYFPNIYCMCLYLYIHNKYTQHTHIYYKQTLLFWVRFNRLTALV